MVRGMEWRRKERRKVGHKRRFYERGWKEEIMRKGSDGEHKRRVQERQRATGGP